MRQVIAWGEYFLRQSNLVSFRSKDPSTQVGAVLVDPSNQTLATGYNGFPTGILETPERWERPTKRRYVIHAEMNAVLQAGKNGGLANAHTLYSTHFPCIECGKFLVQVGISRLVIPSHGNMSATHNPSEEVEHVRQMFAEAGIEIQELPVEWERLGWKIPNPMDSIESDETVAWRVLKTMVLSLLGGWLLLTVIHSIKTLFTK